MAESRSLHLFLLRDSEHKQASWVRANTIAEASSVLIETTQIPVVVLNDYGWTLLPSRDQYADCDERPLPHWEFSTSVRGPADLKCMPGYIRALARSSAPRRSGQVKIGPQELSSSPLDPHSLTAPMIIGPIAVCHSGWKQPYAVDAEMLAGFNEMELLPISIGKQSLLILVPEEEANLEVLDTVQVRLEQDDGCYLVTGQVVRNAVLVRIITIDECSAAYPTEASMNP